MTDKELGKRMYEKAAAFVNVRYPRGWGGCAVMYTEDGQFLTSVYLDAYNSAAGLCMETGAMCEAQKYNLKITHSLCVSRRTEREPLRVLTACGICRERLRYWGQDVKVAVSNPKNAVVFQTLKELDHFYWGDAFADGDREEYEPGIVVPREF